MPGPIQINERRINAKDEIAYQDANGDWRAGPDASGYEQGQFVDTTYAKQARGQRRRTNLVKSIMRSKDVSESEAREQTTEMLQELEDTDDPDERGRIWKKYGSP